MKRKTSSTLNLKNTSLAKLLVEAAKRKLTGYIKIKPESSDASTIAIWWREGKVVAVVGEASLIEKIEINKFVSSRVIDTIKNETLTAPLGDKLISVYNVRNNDIKRLFNEQLVTIYKRLGLTEGSASIVKVAPTAFPWQEMTGLDISGYEVIRLGLEKNFSNRYLDQVPERQHTITTGANKIEDIALDSDYWRIISHCNTNTTLTKISQKLGISLPEIQKKVHILNLLEIVELGITEAAAMKLYHRFNPQSTPLKGRNVSFRRKNGWRTPLLSIAGGNLFVIALTFFGFFQGIELDLLDRFVRFRGTTSNDDIVIVSVSDQDIAQFPSYPIADRYLAQVIENIADANPTVIALDIYRDLPQEPGHIELLTTYSNTPQLIGVEKIAENDQVNPPPILKEQERVGFSDLVLDPDNVLRRGIWMVESQGKLKFNLGALSALQHLSNLTLRNKELLPITHESEEPVKIIQDETDPYRYIFGRSSFTTLKENSGGYWRKNLVGIQNILSFRYNTEDFDHISFFNAYQNKFDPKKLEGKIVLIGVTADSKKDFVYSPLSRLNSQSRPMPGVIAHANIAAELIDAAKGIRPIQVFSKGSEIGWIVFWSLLGITVGVIAIKINLKLKQKQSLVLCGQSAALTLGSFVTGFFAFILGGYWIPILPALSNALLSSLVANFQYQKDLEFLLFADKATKVPNRHYFDSIFEQYLKDVEERGGNLALVLYQIVDWENISTKLDGQDRKKYLREIATIIEEKIRVDNPDNIIGRFSTDTFATVISSNLT